LWNSIAEESYDYQNGGANNRRIQRTTVWHNQSYNETYSYDHLDRLTSASAGSIFSRSYSYDVYGNITSVLGSGGPHPSYSLSYNGNRVNGWSYDASGNLLSDGANSYSYNAVGQITSSSNGNSSYGYDGDSKRVKKTENGVTTYYIRSENLGMVLGEVNSSGTVTRSYLPGIGGAMAVSSGGSVYWLHRDIRGSGRAMTSKTGAVQWRAEYDPFGQVLSEMATVANSKKFTGYERDNNSSATGLDYSVFRYHSSYWGRFQTPDPYDGSYDLSDPQSFNRYLYVENDPVNLTDPLGLFLPGPANDPGPTLNPYGCYDLYVDGIYIGKIGACGGSPVPAVDIGGDVGGGGLETPPMKSPNACADMADQAQDIANDALRLFGSDTKGALKYFDKHFSELYVGRAMPDTYVGAIKFFVGWLNREFRPTINPYYLSGSGFRDEFIDSEKGVKNPASDQTHHFVAYLSAGINNQKEVAALHWQNDLIKNKNRGDYELGIAGFEIGQLLRSDPSKLKQISDIIRKRICK